MTEATNSGVVIVAEADDGRWIYYPLDKAPQQSLKRGAFDSLGDAIESAVEKTPANTNLKVFRQRQRMAGEQPWPSAIKGIAA